MTVTGSITLIDDDIGQNGSGCYGQGGYDDMYGGQTVVVKDAAGAVVAMGALNRGEAVTDRRCVFSFTVAGVPQGSQFYTVEVSRRGQTNYTEQQLRAPVNLILGGD